MFRLLLAAFTQVYSENQMGKAEQQDLEKLEVWFKISCKLGAQESIVFKRLTLSKRSQAFSILALGKIL